MGKVATSATLPVSQEASNYDEVFMQQSLLFDDSLKDLKNLRAQLYSAAEYFELSYSNDDQKQIVVETLKDYAIKALVNTVDHLGSVTYKVNDLLDEKVVEVSVAELRVSCIEQRIKTCHEYMDREGRTQQSLVISTPKYHKRYILPGKFLLLLKSMFMMLNDHIFAFLKFISSVGETMHGANRTKSKYVGYNLDDEGEWPHFRNAVRATIRETPPSTARRGRSPSPSLQPQSSGAFSFTSTMPKKDLERRSVSPYRFPLLRTGSRSSRPPTPKISRPTTPNPSRPTTPNPSNARQRYPSEPRKSSSMRLSAERDHGKDIEQYPSKSKRLLKALLSRRKSKKDDMLYTYLDEY
ncbi:Protein ABIL2 [Glycine max]|nr:Protein ABIL2 [Glycine max]